MFSKDLARMLGTPNKELETGLRKEWNKWQNTNHPDDCMSFLEYCSNIGRYKGYTVTLTHDLEGDMRVVFYKESKLKP